MYDQTKGITKPFYFLHLTKGVNQDLQIWLQFLSKYNGQSFIQEPHYGNAEVSHFFSDAPKISVGITYGSSLIDSLWPLGNTQYYYSRAISNLHCNFYVCTQLHNSKEIFHYNNMAVVNMINKQTCNCPIRMRIV